MSQSIFHRSTLDAHARSLRKKVRMARRGTESFLAAVKSRSVPAGHGRRIPTVGVQAGLVAPRLETSLTPRRYMALA
jgi:hypothetical protein